jgi:hypothetical protein
MCGRKDHIVTAELYPLERLSIVVFALDDDRVAYADNEKRAQA